MDRLQCIQMEFTEAIRRKKRTAEAEKIILLAGRIATSEIQVDEYLLNWITDTFKEERFFNHDTWCASSPHGASLFVFARLLNYIMRSIGMRLYCEGIAFWDANNHAILSTKGLLFKASFLSPLRGNKTDQLKTLSKDLEGVVPPFTNWIQKAIAHVNNRRGDAGPRPKRYNSEISEPSDFYMEASKKRLRSPPLVLPSISELRLNFDPSAAAFPSHNLFPLSGNPSSLHPFLGYSNSYAPSKPSISPHLTLPPFRYPANLDAEATYLHEGSHKDKSRPTGNPQPTSFICTISPIVHIKREFRQPTEGEATMALVQLGGASLH